MVKFGKSVTKQLIRLRIRDTQCRCRRRRRHLRKRKQIPMWNEQLLLANLSSVPAGFFLLLHQTN